MASFLTRAFKLPAAAPSAGNGNGGGDVFDDIAGHYHADDIRALAAAGITLGCGDGSGYCPDDPATRVETATLLFRALKLDVPEDDGMLFPDVALTSVHRPAIVAFAIVNIPVIKLIELIADPQ